MVEPGGGVTTHTFDGFGRLKLASLYAWGGASIKYTYTDANRIKTIDSGDETVTYHYDARGRLGSIMSSKGWSRTGIGYNSLGSITAETVNIPVCGVVS